MTETLHVGIDIDDVIFPWYDTAHQLCTEHGITNGRKPSTWAPYDDYGCTPAEWDKVISAGTYSGRLYLEPEPIVGALLALIDLTMRGHRIHLVTARGFGQHGDVVRSHSVQWLADWNVPHDTLTFSKDKTVVRADVFADDGPHNVEALRTAGIPTCVITAEHNRDFVHPWRAVNLAEFVNHLKSGIRL